ncbi:MAG: MBL fold metallo-hydrolase [Cyanobacteria bacterium J06628_6]
MLFRQLFDRESSTYTYLIADPNTREAVLVDPVLEQVERDLKLLRELGLTLVYCLETHIHADHITGTGTLRDRTGCQGLVPKNAQAACASGYISDGQMLTVGSVEIKAIETHGHTDNHMTYWVNGDRVLTGDALLIRSCGRTDFQSGNPGTLYDRITQQLFALPDETLVYPAHDYRGHTVSTIGEEKRFNPRLIDLDQTDTPMRSREAFIELMNGLDLPDPKKIMEAVPANESCGRHVAAILS